MTEPATRVYSLDRKRLNSCFEVTGVYIATTKSFNVVPLALIAAAALLFNCHSNQTRLTAPYLSYQAKTIRVRIPAFKQKAFICVDITHAQQRLLLSHNKGLIGTFSALAAAYYISALNKKILINGSGPNALISSCFIPIIRRP